MLALLLALSATGLPVPAFGGRLPAPSFVSEKRCEVRGSTCPCGCRDGEPCTCAAAKRQGFCGDSGCRCRHCGDYCSCGVFGPCGGDCDCPPDRPEWHTMEAGGQGLYRRPAYGSDWVLFGYWDGESYWPYLRDSKGWGPARKSPPVKPPETHRTTRAPAFPGLAFPPFVAPAVLPAANC